MSTYFGEKIIKKEKKRKRKNNLQKKFCKLSIDRYLGCTF
jgi:hypothetical protein